jgi:eukaryotic-like serine/threonine-protein kinase
MEHGQGMASQRDEKVMTPERWIQIKDLFNRALDLEPDRRIVFLDEACGDDRLLRSEIDSLLAVHDESDTLIDRPAFRVAAELFASTQTQTVVGRVINHYRVVRELGHGGMGEVYLAEDTRLGRKVALKLLPLHFTKDADRVRRFQQEARAASALNHPNIVTIHEIGEAEELRFIVTEYIEGETLREKMKRSRMRLEEVLNVAIQTSRALEAAHNAGIAHRDIKPENIMLRADGYVKVVDFGLAKLTERQEKSGSDQSTNPGIVMGTTRYMSPEQARGQKIDTRTDIFSLGVLLYEMVSGRVPFDGETNSDVIAAILHKEAPPLSDYAPRIPIELELIINKAIRKKREERYQRIEEFTRDLRNLKQRLEQPSSEELDSERDLDSSRTIPVSTAEQRARSTLQLERLFDRIKRFKIWFIVAMASIVLAAGSGIVWYSWIKPDPKRLSPKFDKIKISKVATSGNAYGGVISPDGKYIAYTINSSLWIRQVATDSELQLVPAEDVQYWGIAFSPDSNFIYYIIEDNKNPTLGSLYRIPTIGGVKQKLLEKVVGLTFSPDGRYISFVRNSSNEGESVLMVADSNGENERQLNVRKGPGRYLGVSWSPDGRLIAATVVINEPGTSYTTMVGKPVDDGPEIPLTSHRWPFITGFAWLPDGSGFILNAREEGSGINRLWRLSYPDDSVQIITNDYNSYWGVSMTADATVLITSTVNSFTNIWTAPDGDVSKARQLTSGTGSYGKIDYTNNGKILFGLKTGDYDHIWIMEADGSGRRQLTSGQSSNGTPSMTADGRYITFTSNRSGMWNIWRMNSDGSGLKQLTSGASDISPQCSPDGRWVFYISDIDDWTLCKVPLEGGNAVELYKTSTEQMPAISPDSKFIAYQYFDLEERKSGVIVRPVDGEQITKVFDISPARSIRWAGNGQGLLFDKKIDDYTEILYQPISGGLPRQVTNFKEEEIFWFDWSPDGKYLVCSRGRITYDLVLISNN